MHPIIHRIRRRLIYICDQIYIMPSLHKTICQVNMYPFGATTTYGITYQEKLHLETEQVGNL